MTRGSRIRAKGGSIRTFSGGFRFWREVLHPRGPDGRFIDAPDYYVPAAQRTNHGGRRPHLRVLEGWDAAPDLWSSTGLRSNFLPLPSGHNLPPGQEPGSLRFYPGYVTPKDSGSAPGWTPPSYPAIWLTPRSIPGGIQFYYGDVLVSEEWLAMTEEERQRAFYRELASIIYEPPDLAAFVPDAPTDSRTAAALMREAYSSMAVGDTEGIDAEFPGLLPLVRREAVLAALPVDDGPIADPLPDQGVEFGVEFIPIPEPKREDFYDPATDTGENLNEGRSRFNRAYNGWHAGMWAAVSEGLLSPQDAVALGAGGDIGISAAEHWAPLPSTLWHVGTDTRAILGEGFKSRHELGMVSGRGLAGGSSLTISFTDDETAARNIYSSMLEARAFAAGDLTINDLLDADERGEWGDYPGAVMENYGRIHVWGKFSPWVRADITAWAESQGFTRDPDDPPHIPWMSESGTPITPLSLEEWFVNDGGDLNRPPTVDEIPMMRAAIEAYLTDEDRRRPDLNFDGPTTQAGWDFYTYFIRSRQNVGGPMDPYYAGTDWRALGRMSSSDIAIIEVEPIPGAMGYYLPAEHEWRTASGDAVTITNAFKPDSQILPEPRRTLWRGLEFGPVSPEDAQAIAADPERWVRDAIITRTRDGLGIHWTDDASVAWNFAMDGNVDGPDQSYYFDPDEGPKVRVGLVIEGAAPERDVLIPGTPEWQDWADSEGIFEPDSREREVTLTTTDDVSIGAITITFGTEDGFESLPVDLDRLESLGFDQPVVAPQMAMTPPPSPKGGWDDRRLSDIRLQIQGMNPKEKAALQTAVFSYPGEYDLAGLAKYLYRADSPSTMLAAIRSPWAQDAALAALGFVREGDSTPNLGDEPPSEDIDLITGAWNLMVREGGVFHMRDGVLSAAIPDSDGNVIRYSHPDFTGFDSSMMRPPWEEIIRRSLPEQVGDHPLPFHDPRRTALAGVTAIAMSKRAGRFPSAFYVSNALTAMGIDPETPPTRTILGAADMRSGLLATFGADDPEPSIPMLDEVVDTYGWLTDTFPGVGFTALAGPDHAVVEGVGAGTGGFTTRPGTLYFAKSMLHEDGFAKMAAMEAASGAGLDVPWSAAVSPGATMAHEFAHALFAGTVNPGDGADGAYWARSSRALEAANLAAYAYMGENGEGFIPLHSNPDQAVIRAAGTISGYARTSDVEAYAELFTAYMTGRDDTPFPAERDAPEWVQVWGDAFMETWAEEPGSDRLSRHFVTLNQGSPTDVTLQDLNADGYQMAHRPNPEGPPAWDLLSEEMLPADVYDHPEWYVGDPASPASQESIAALRALRGKPDAMVTIYRSAPQGAVFRPGDWVSLSPAYAKQTGLHPDDPAQDLPVISMLVPASEVRFAGDDLNEFGWWPPPDPEAPPLATDTEGQKYVEFPDVLPPAAARQDILLTAADLTTIAEEGFSGALAQWRRGNDRDDEDEAMEGANAFAEILAGEFGADFTADFSSEDEITLYLPPTEEQPAWEGTQFGSVSLDSAGRITFTLDEDTPPEALDAIRRALARTDGGDRFELSWYRDSVPPVMVDARQAREGLLGYNPGVDPEGSVTSLPTLVASVTDSSGPLPAYPAIQVMIYDSPDTHAMVGALRAENDRKEMEELGGVRSTTMDEEYDLAVARMYGEQFRRDVANRRTDTPLIQAWARFEAEGGGQDFAEWFDDNGYREMVEDQFTQSFVGRKSGETYWSQAYVEAYDGGDVTVTVEFFNEEGDKVGESTRNLRSSGVVYHALLALDDSVQGEGIAYAYNRDNDAFYLANGYTDVTVSAALSDGGYAWAADLFEADVGTKGVFLRRVKDRAQSIIESPSASRDERISAIQALLDIQAMEDAEDAGVPPHFWSIAHAGYHDQVKDKREWIARSVLRGVSWSGRKDLQALSGIDPSDVPKAEDYVPDFTALPSGWAEAFESRAAGDSWQAPVSMISQVQVAGDGRIIDPRVAGTITPAADGYFVHLTEVEDVNDAGELIAAVSLVNDLESGGVGTSTVTFSESVPSETRREVMEFVNQRVDEYAGDTPPILDAEDVADSWDPLDEEDDSSRWWARRPSMDMYAGLVQSSDYVALFAPDSPVQAIFPRPVSVAEDGDGGWLFTPEGSDEPTISARLQPLGSTFAMKVRHLGPMPDSADEDAIETEATILNILFQAEGRATILTYAADEGDTSAVRSWARSMQGFRYMPGGQADPDGVAWYGLPSGMPGSGDYPYGSFGLGGGNRITPSAVIPPYGEARYDVTGPTDPMATTVAPAIVQVAEAALDRNAVWPDVPQWQVVSVALPPGVNLDVMAETKPDLTLDGVEVIPASFGDRPIGPTVRIDLARWGPARDAAREKIEKAREKAQAEAEAQAEVLRADFIEWFKASHPEEGDLEIHLTSAPGTLTMHPEPGIPPHMVVERWVDLVEWSRQREGVTPQISLLPLGPNGRSDIFDGIMASRYPVIDSPDYLYQPAPQ